MIKRSNTKNSLRKIKGHNMTTLAILKKNAMALVAGLAIIGFSSFKLAKADTYWFEVDASGNITNHISGPGSTCPDTDKPQVCAIELEESYVDLSGPQPQATVSNLNQTQVQNPSGIPFEQTRSRDMD